MTASMSAVFRMDPKADIVMKINRISTEYKADARTQYSHFRPAVLSFPLIVTKGVNKDSLRIVLTSICACHGMSQLCRLPAWDDHRHVTLSLYNISIYFNLFLLDHSIEYQ